VIGLARVALVLTVSVLAGCGAVDRGTGGNGPATAPAATAAPSVPKRASPQAGTSQSGTSQSGTSPTGLVPGRTATDSSGRSITVTPVTLRRQSGLVLLELTGQNNDPNEAANLADLVRRADSLAFDSATLIDAVNRKRYLVARDSAGACLCTAFVGGLVVQPGQSGLVSAYFSAPADSVRTVNVEVPGVGIFADVPLS
jgi:hypothetical protein